MKRSKCMSCGSSDGLNKAMDTFKGFFYEKPYKIYIIVSSTAFDANALNLIPGIMISA